MLLPMLAWACNEAPRSSDPPVVTGNAEAARDVARIDADVRLEVALKRIAVLEREVAELKADPAPVETDLLRQQLSATQNALADASRDSLRDDAAPVPSSDSADPPTASSREGRAPQRSSASRSGTANTPRPKPPAAKRSSLELDLR